jgi:hypothetical protein
VTKLGQFSPIGRFFSLGNFFICRSRQKNYQHFFFAGNSYMIIFTKMCWATFYAIFIHKLIWSPCSQFAQISTSDSLTTQSLNHFLSCGRIQ